MPYADPELQREYQRAWIAARRQAWLQEHGPCIDCGTWEGLEVDHADASTKVTHRVWSWSSARREAELAKCVARCRACHLVKTKAAGEYVNRLQGTKHPASKLTDEAVRVIKASGEGPRALARRFGVNSGTITNIRKGRAWKHVV